ncbi:MAG: NAD(P) transhydrogenase subunit alpha [Trueperaceae bacterium]|nr:NAD(P) transhydrogenase subunit alpha [Trueperaceae bacterium]
MHFVSLTDHTPGEHRVALTPNAAARLVDLGATVRLEAGYGGRSFFDDASYRDAGVDFAPRETLLREADVLLTLNPPDPDDLAMMPEGATVIGLMDPFRRTDVVRALVARKLAGICMELIPRSTYAQKMDVLSSQASLAGYAAVLRAAERIDKSFPMMSTPAGTIAPARVFVIGVGVAGLQAIATAKRLGARVDAYDTRPVVAEQVRSLGAKFVELDVGETGETEQGYAKELTPEQLEMQRQQMARVVAEADVVITTAQLFGRPAPRIVSAEMVAGMRPGSVVVDLAAGSGGNVEGSRPDEEVLTEEGIRIVGATNLPSSVARDAGQMFANNMVHLITHAWDAESGRMTLDPEEDPVVGACLLTQAGEVRDERVSKVLAEEDES